MIIFRYLSKEVLSAMVVIILVLLAILISNQFIHYLHSAAAGTITLKTVMQVMALQVPLLLGYLIPLGFFLGTVFVLGRWYAEHEMAVMTACGLSPEKLVAMILTLSLTMVAVETYLMLWVEPKAQWYRIQLLDRATALLAVEKIPVGYFEEFDTTKGIVVYSEKKSQDHQGLEKIFLARPVPPDKKHSQEYWEIASAKKMTEEKKPDLEGSFLVLHDGYRYLAEPRDKNYQIIHFSEFGLTTMPKKPITRPKDRIKFLRTSELWKNFHNPKNAAEFHWRIAMPFSLLILAFLAIPLSYIKPRQGQFGKIFPALLLYLIYMNLIFVGTAWIGDGKLSKHLGLLGVHAMFFVAALLLFYRTNVLHVWQGKRSYENS